MRERPLASYSSDGILHPVKSPCAELELLGAANGDPDLDEGAFAAAESQTDIIPTREVVQILH